jgi:hypothetical protein
VEGKVAVDEEAGPMWGEMTADSNDVPEVVKGTAVWTCGVIWGSGAMMEGVVPLK